MKKWIMITILLLSICQVGVFATHQEDVKFGLLRQLGQVAEGDTARLQILYELTQVTKSQPKVRVYYIDRLLKEAQAQNHPKYKCLAYLSHIYVAYNMLDAEAVKHWEALLEPLARKEKFYDFLFMGKQCTIDFLSLTEEFELQEKEALKMLKEAQELGSIKGTIAAYQCLYHVYYMTFRQKEGIEVLKKAYDLAVSIDEYFLAIEVNGFLIDIYELLGDNANWLKYIEMHENYVQKILQLHPELEFSFDVTQLMLHIYRLNYSVEIGDFRQAERSLQLAITCRMKPHGINATRFHTACNGYYQATGQLEKALGEVDILIGLYGSFSIPSRNEAMHQKANILLRLKRYDEALDLYKIAGIENDSLQLSVLNKQTEHIRQSYDADILLLKQQQTDRYVQIFSISVVGIILLVFTFFVVRTYRIRNSLRKSEKEMREIVQVMEQMNLAKDRFLSGIGTGIKDPLDVIVSGSLRLVSDKGMGAVQRKQLSESINETSTYLMKVINGILDLSRYESGMMKYSLSEIELVSFVQSLVANVDSEQIDLQVVLPVEKQIIIETDANRLTDFFMRLFSKGNTQKQLALELVLSGDGRKITCSICGTLLAGEQTQDVMVMNEINRLFIEHFDGTYQIVKTDPLEGCVVCVWPAGGIK